MVCLDTGNVKVVQKSLHPLLFLAPRKLIPPLRILRRNHALRHFRVRHTCHKSYEQDWPLTQYRLSLRCHKNLEVENWTVYVLMLSPFDAAGVEAMVESSQRIVAQARAPCDAAV